MCGYLVGGGSSEPNSRHRNTPPGPWEKGPQGPRSNPLKEWGHQGPGTNSSDRAAQRQENGVKGEFKCCIYE